MKSAAYFILLAALGLTAFALTATSFAASAWAQSEEAASPQPEPDEDKARTERDDDEAPPGSPFTAGELKTHPRDTDFGQREPHRKERFVYDDAHLGAVDRRRQLSPVSDRNILAPLAQTPAEGTVSYGNYNIAGSVLTYAASDQLAVTAGALLPLGNEDFLGSVSAKYKFYETRDLIVSVLPFGAYANGAQRLDTSHTGLGAGLLADLHLSDSIVVGAGVSGFAALYGTYERNSTDCTRSEFRNDGCEIVSDGEALPAGGHWMAATLGTVWYVADSLAFNVEFIHGLSWGSFLGVEDDATSDDTDGDLEAAGRARLQDPEFATGLPNGGGPVISLGATWSGERSAVQFAMVFLREPDNPDTQVLDESRSFNGVPMLSGSFNF
ncbi:MAG: hypothetical protein ACLFVJ_12125 [Persicimonas sp.]